MKTYAAIVCLIVFSLNAKADPQTDPADLAVIEYDGTFVDRDGVQTAAILNISKVDRATVSFDVMIQHFPFNGCSIDGQAQLQNDGTFLSMSSDLPRCQIRIRPTAAAIEIIDIDDHCQPTYCGFSGYIGTTAIPRTSMSSADADAFFVGLLP